MPWRARNNNTKWMTSCKILLPKKSLAQLIRQFWCHWLATATTAKSQASSLKHVEAAPATAGMLLISSNTAVSNILDQFTGLRGYFQMQPWTDLSHSTLITTIIIMKQPIQQYLYIHTCKSSKLCTGLPACRVVTSVNSLDWSLITLSFEYITARWSAGWIHDKNFEQISMKVGAIFNCCWFAINKVVCVFIVQSCSEFIVF